jgi:D-glycero-D-manno-heptose 1,7-bisphosphate phosphatase
MIPNNLPFGATIGDDGVWRQMLTRVPGTALRPALFLDRDGVVVDEVHYLHKVADMKLSPGAADVIRRANAHDVPVVIVTNQAGIGRGKYGWAEFAAVQDAMLDELADAGAFVNAVLACPHHADGVAPYDVANHPARKPNPGMLLAAAEMLPIGFEGSWIVGDRAGDIDAAKRAGCTGGVHVLSGHGSDEGERDTALALRTVGFDVKAAKSIADAGGMIPLLQNEE